MTVYFVECYVLTKTVSNSTHLNPRPIPPFGSRRKQGSRTQTFRSPTADPKTELRRAVPVPVPVIHELRRTRRPARRASSTSSRPAPARREAACATGERPRRRRAHAACERAARASVRGRRARGAGRAEQLRRAARLTRVAASARRAGRRARRPQSTSACSSWPDLAPPSSSPSLAGGHG